MSATVQKPSPAKVLAEHKSKLNQVSGTAKDRIKTVTVEHQNTLSTLRAQEQSQLNDAYQGTIAAIDASAQSVEEKQKAVEEALKALAEAKKEHQTKTRSLTQAFNKAATDIRTAVSAQEIAAKQARKAALAAEKQKVAEAKRAGRSAFVAEAKALVDYEVFVVKDTTLRVTNGFVAVGKALKTAFNAGYAGETGVKLPESLAKRQTAASAPAAAPQA